MGQTGPDSGGGERGNHSPQGRDRIRDRDADADSRERGRYRSPPRRRGRSSSPGRRRDRSSPPPRRRNRDDSPQRRRRASPSYEPLHRSPVREPVSQHVEDKPQEKAAPAKKKSSWRDEQRRETQERHRKTAGIPSRGQETRERDTGRHRQRRDRERREDRDKDEDKDKDRDRPDTSSKPQTEAPAPGQRMIEVIANDRLGGKVRVKCYPDDTVGTLKKLIAGQKGTKANKIVLKKWYTTYKDHVKLSDYEIHDGMSLEMT